jgi:hypothetical protein
MLAQDPYILSAVMFGRGRFQNGVLIDPKPQFAFDPKDEAKLENFRTLIWQVSVSIRFLRFSLRNLGRPWSA